MAAAKYTTVIRAAEEPIEFHKGIGMTEDLTAKAVAKRLLMIEQQVGDADHRLQSVIELGCAACGQRA